MNNDRIVVLDGARSPIGSFGATAAREALTRAGVEGADVREVVGGRIGQVGAGRPQRPSRAIALGHPVGATGTTPTLRVAREIVRRDLELGVVIMCIGGGQAQAALFRRG